MNYGVVEEPQPVYTDTQLLIPNTTLNDTNALSGGRQQVPPPYNVLDEQRRLQQQRVGAHPAATNVVVVNIPQGSVNEVPPPPVDVDPADIQSPTRTDLFVHEEVKIALSHPDEDTSVDNACGLCCLEMTNCGVEDEGPAIKRALNIGGRGLFYAIFSSSPSCCGLKIFLQVSLCLVALFLLVLNLTALGIKLTNGHHQTHNMVGLLAVNVVLPVLLMIYAIVDLSLHVRFVVRRNTVRENGTFELHSLSSAFKANFARMIIPELLIYPLLLTSLFAARNSKSSSSLFSNDSLGYLMTISFIFTAIILLLSTVVYRLYVYVFAMYKLKEINKGVPRYGHSWYGIAILSLFIYYSFTITVLQILMTVYVILKSTEKMTYYDEDGNPYRSYSSVYWSLWYYMVYGGLAHTFGMTAVVFVNYRLIRGLCVEIFFKVCRRIHRAIVVHFTDNTQQLNQFYAALESVRPDAGYPEVTRALFHPCKNIMSIFIGSLFGFASAGLVLINVGIANDPDNKLYDTVFGYVIIGAVCLANIQTFFVALFVALVIACLVLLIVVMLVFLRYGGWWRLMFYASDRRY